MRSDGQTRRGPIGHTLAADGLEGPSPFPPIADYAFLSDCEVTTLIAPSGNVEWLCLPRMDSPSVFGAILDRDAGGFRFGPADMRVPAARRYLPGTMVLETSWSTSTGWVIVRDVLLIGPWRNETARSRNHRRTPTDYDAEHVLLRTVRCVNGEVQMVLDCEPVFDYGRTLGSWQYEGKGYRAGICRAEGSDVELRLTSDMNLGFEGPRALSRTLLKEGQQRFVALSGAGGWPAHVPERLRPPGLDRASLAALAGQGTLPGSPWRSYLERSALTLKGLTYDPTGAVIAAATTSLPETPGGERNWDYRFSWIRDSTFALWGLYTLGFDWEANDFMYFVADVADCDEDLQIMYGIGGERTLTEQRLDHLQGYAEGARPVRVGNAAYAQRQHDMWGAVLDSVYLHTTSRDHLDERIWPILEKQVEAALAHWREPDRGIWEVRGEAKHFTSSKVMCWVAADRGARLARLKGHDETAERWQAAADEIHADICANGLDERGVFTQHYDTDALDASLLLMPLVRFLPASDERIRRTVLAIADELTEEGLVLRYRPEETDDGLAGEEGSFTICSFWLVSALVEIGELHRGRRLCEKLLSYASVLGLYGEEIDPQTGRHLGNFPQAFTHLALINAVMHVIDAEARHPRAAEPLSPATGGRAGRHNGRADASTPGPAAQRVAAGQRGGTGTEPG